MISVASGNRFAAERYAWSLSVCIFGAKTVLTLIYRIIFVNYNERKHADV
jgi:hypothetical protein